MATIPRPSSRQPLPSHAKRVYSGDRYSVYEWDQELFDGSHQTFEKILSQDTVTILPLLPDGQLVFTQQEQPGMKPFTSAVGGLIDAGEDPETAALRELQEETGYTCEKLILFHAVQPLGKIEWADYMFVALNCKKTHEQDLDAGEKIQLFSFPVGEILQHISPDTFRNWDLALLLFRHPEKLQELMDLASPQR